LTTTFLEGFEASILRYQRP